LKELLRQYELRERHFECVIRSKELEVLLSRARAAEQKQLAESEKARADRQDEEVMSSSYNTDPKTNIPAASTTKERAGGSEERPDKFNRTFDRLLQGGECK
jgi:hypothetical protein